MDTPNEETLYEKYSELVNRLAVLSLMIDNLNKRIVKIEDTIKHISPRCIMKNLPSDEEDIYY